MDDRELLQEYVKQGSEKAFATLVSRHVDLVYAAAFRRLGDEHLAEEVTQTVFIILARKAPRIGHGIVLAAWLFRTARYAAADALRSEYRRQQRERQAMALALSDPEPESAWNNVEPRLDSALGRLNEKDRSAILLRFFESKSLREVGRDLGIDEDAARKRVARAVAKLRLLLGKADAPFSFVALTGLLTSHAIHVAPAGLAVSATNAALAHGAGISASILAMVKATVNSMLWSKAKKILAVGGATVLMVAWVLFQKQNVPLPRSDQVAARHLAATGANKLRFNVRSESTGTACMSCHDVNARQAVLVRELGAKGFWTQPTQGWKGGFEICTAGPNRIIETIHADGVGEFVRGWDGKQGWCMSPTSGAKLLSIGEVEELRRDADFLAWPESEHWMRAVRSTNFAARRCYQVDLIDNSGERGARFFDVNTGLQAGATWFRKTAEGPVLVTRELFNYREFDEVLIPATVTRVEPGRRQVFIVASVVFADVAESRFAPPEQVQKLLETAPGEDGLRLN